MAESARVLRTPILWTAYLLIPAAGWGLFHGAPIGIVGAVAVSVVWWLRSYGRPLPGGAWLVALVIAKVLAAFLLVDRGFTADYFANATWTPPIEASTDFHSRAHTRIDRRLAFGRPAASDLPLFFFNDAARFNFYQAGEPDRAALPFSVTWRGDAVASDADSRRTFYLNGAHVTAELWVDDARVVRLEPAAEEATGSAPWLAGMRSLRVTLSSAQGGGRRFAAGFVDATGRRVPFDDALVMAQAAASWRLALDRVVRIASLLIDGLLMLVLVWCLVPAVYAALRAFRGVRVDASTLALGSIAAIVTAAAVSARKIGHLILLLAGNDWLTYESQARDIALHGPLMLLGRPLGHADAFYFQPFYPYFLAAVHLVLGEDMTGVYFVQWLLACAAILTVWRIAATLFDDTVAAVTLGLGAAFFALKLMSLALTLLTETLFMALTVIWVRQLVDVARRPGASRAAMAAGVIGGMATLVRSTLVAGWVLTLPVVALARRRARIGARAVALLLVVMLAVVALATLRNGIAAREFVPVTTSFGINLLLGNQPPAGVAIAPGSGYVSTVRQYAFAAPGHFARNLWHKTLYTLGFFNAMLPGNGTSYGLVMIWLASLIGFGVMTQGASRVPPNVAVLPALVALSHFIVVVAIFPHVYGDRLILPIYLLLLPYAALGLTGIARAILRRPLRG